VHALVVEDAELVGHASVVQRRVMHGGRALRTGYIEGVAVREDRRRRGHGAAMMSVLERVVRSGYQLGTLGASADGGRLYASRGVAAVAGAVLGCHAGRDPPDRGCGRQHLRSAGIRAG
jgi:aminoglycoside 2'-N-acetyltransferase I